MTHPWLNGGVTVVCGQARQDELMSRRAPDHDVDEQHLDVESPKKSAAGVPAVAITMKRVNR